MRVVNNVAALRKEQGLSQAALADLVGIHRATIVNIEQSNHAPSIGTCFRIAAALKRSLLEVFAFVPAGESPADSSARE